METTHCRTNITNPYRPTLLTGLFSVFALVIAFVHSPLLAARSFGSSGTAGTDKFAVAYAYETGASPQYGGNISGATWKHAGGTAQTYAYSLYVVIRKAFF